MKKRFAQVGAAAVIALLGLTACGGTSSNKKPAPAPSPSMSKQAAPSTSKAATPKMDKSASASVAITTAKTAAGEVLVDGKGRTIYIFTKDAKNATKSACAGDCATKWPTVSAKTADLKGVTGKIGSITGVDGKPQLTLNGMPLYYFAMDAKPGDVKGNGVGGVWFALDSKGQPVKATK